MKCLSVLEPRLAPSGFLRLQRGQIGGGRQQIIRAEIGDDRNHERGPGSGPVAVLHVVELPRDVARRAAGKPRHRTQPAQIGAVADRAGGDLAAAAVVPVVTRASPFLRLPGGT